MQTYDTGALKQVAAWLSCALLKQWLHDHVDIQREGNQMQLLQLDAHAPKTSSEALQHSVPQQGGGPQQGGKARNITQIQPSGWGLHSMQGATSDLYLRPKG